MMKLLAAVLILSAPAPVAPPAPLAAQAFERIKALEGEWRGRSSKGWEDRVSFQIVAAGSCVVERSDFDAHPGETMFTMFHMDGDDLVLTHYCVAKNQPRLRATEISPDLKTIVFTFRDATNLRSRDQGHMDKAVFRFLDADRFTAQWTWYQDGQERWLETIELVRQTRPAATGAAGGACH
jgi:hypothetical protein